GAVCLAPAEYRPSDAYGFVRLRDDCHFSGFAFEQLTQPRSAAAGIAVGVFHNRSRALNEQGAQMPVALFRDAPAFVLFAAARIGSSGQSHPCGKIATAPEP